MQCRSIATTQKPTAETGVTRNENGRMTPRPVDHGITWDCLGRNYEPKRFQ
jgi:hypothetical protein